MGKHPPDIADALIRIPRHHFIPRRAWATPGGAGKGYWIDREADPDTWWGAVYSDTIIYTQLDDGKTELTPENAARTFAPTSSASAPSLVAAFLRRLGPEAGDRVLEIGTGTGWTAGLLSQLTGDTAHVTTVEIDPELSATALRNLRALGLHPQVIAGEGAQGVTTAAPFDRVHVTCGVRHIPYAWVAQTRPGGVLVLPYAPTSRLLRLTVRDEGTASGRFYEECAFMLLRAQRDQPGKMPHGGCHRVRELDSDPALLCRPDAGLRALLDALVGDTPWVTPQEEIILQAGASRATVESGTVVQMGPRNLWDEAEHVYRSWERHGRAGLDRIGVTVYPGRQYVWLDESAVPVADLFAMQDIRREK